MAAALGALSLLLWASGAAVGGQAGHTRSESAEGVAAYVAAIRYFNPGIDAYDAYRIVTAIGREARAEGVDPRLVVAIVATESGFDRTARSRAGAMGLGQLMPETAAGDGLTDTADIDQNVRGTVLTLSGNLRHYGRLPLQRRYVDAIAAYNAGTGAVDRYGGVPPYDETIRYVWKVVVLWRRLTGLSSS
ncbi:MAG: lytic transglycosylase domain-containing protein [Candidatus Eremiobacteraeota bacterium]|nr:lytic transglycosylase domain-containing protein [Candidatus Eremiobacteraeota bacterium]